MGYVSDRILLKWLTYVQYDIKVCYLSGKMILKCVMWVAQ